MIKTRILLTMSLVLWLCKTEGQTMYGSVKAPNNTQPTDPGSQLVNVDMYTGTGYANVPIYSYSINGLDLGIALSYNAKGVKVDQLASSVGLGWSLQAGGSISRQAKGLEDEVTMPARYTTATPHDYLQGRMVHGANYGGFYNSANVDDQEHDLFHVNLCGRMLTLQFYKEGNNLRYTTYPKSEIKVEFIVKDMVAPTGIDMTYNHTATYSGTTTPYFNPLIANIGQHEFEKVLTFNIIDEQGNKFLFERGDYERKDYNYSTNTNIKGGAQGTYYPTSQWDLKRLEMASGFTVVYDYKKTDVDILQSQTETIDGGLAYSTNGGLGGPWTVTNNPLTVSKNIWRGRKTHLSRITYPNGVIVNFDLKNSMQTSSLLVPSNVSRCDCWGDFRLDQITVESSFGSDMKNVEAYNFRYSYFNSPKYGITATDVPMQNNCQPLLGSWSIPSYMHPDVAKADHYSLGYRLKLNKIEKVINPSTLYTVPSETLYEFEYDMSKSLPYRLASQKDFYGYYNGNSTLPVVLKNMNYLNGDIANNPQYDYHYLSIPKYLKKGTLTKSPLFEAYNIAENSSVGLSSTGLGTDRSHNAEHMQAWILKKIKNGIGGEIEIKYRGDYTLTNPTYQYWYEIPVSPGGGYQKQYTIEGDVEGADVNDGLIVEEVIERNKYSHQHTKTIKYEYSGGQRFNRGGYTWYPKFYGTGDIHLNGFVSPDEYINGSNHGFSIVNKFLLDHNGNKLSREVYEFSNLTLPNVPYTNMKKRTGLYFHTIAGQLDRFRMGNLLKRSRYDVNTSNPNIYHLLEEDLFEYDEIDVTPDNGSPGPYKTGLVSMSHFQGPYNTNNTSGAYVFANGTVHEYYYPMNYKFWQVKRTTNKSYSRDNVNSSDRIMTTVSDYEYDLDYNLQNTYVNDSKGNTYFSHVVYNRDASFWYSSLAGRSPLNLHYLDIMNNNNMQYPLMMYKFKGTGEASELVHFECSSPYTFTANGTLNVRFPARFSSKQVTTQFYNIIEPNIGGNIQEGTFLKRGNALNYLFNPSTTDFGSNLGITSYTKFYDNGMNGLEVWNNENKEVESFIWDTKHGLLLAEVKNAEYENIAFTSFEGGDTYSLLGTADFNKGNWDFNRNNIRAYSTLPGSKTVTGRYAYLLQTPTSGSIGEIIGKPLKAREYLLTFWCQSVGGFGNPQIRIFNGATDKGLLPVPTPVNEIGNWKLYAIRFTAVNNDFVKISSPTENSGYYIDEIRLHPTNAAMVSYTHEHLIGQSSTNTENNVISYLEYDVFGRYLRTRDMRGNIVEQLEERYNDLDDQAPGSSNPGSNQ